MKYLLILTLRLYRLAFSPVLKSLTFSSCRFTPSCSEYTIRSIAKYGSLKGLKLGFSQLLHCHPFSVSQPKTKSTP